MKRLIAEFEPQSFVQIVFPHAKTDWAPYLEEARKTFVDIIKAISRYEEVLLVCDDVEAVLAYFQDTSNIRFVAYETNDTWARDISAISIEIDQTRHLLDFRFDAWGGKYEAQKDDRLTRALAAQYACPLTSVDFVLEGGAIETNGRGVLLTTASCMLRRNPLDEASTTQKLKEYFGVREVLYLRHGGLVGDDTDGHIDTLARFVDERTIAYVHCDDTEDVHYEPLLRMRQELEAIADRFDFRLVALPFCDALTYEGARLPATYANFLVINGAVLVPTYGVKQDERALAVMQTLFPKHDIIGVDCSVLVRQHGSLHCVTMQFHCV